MKKSFKVTALVALLLVAFSMSAFAVNQEKVEDKVAEWTFGDKKDHWGFVYELGYDEDGLKDEGTLTPYYKINEKKGPHNKTITGAYIRDGQEVKTTLGLRLGIDYSPFIAKFDGGSRILGLRVGEFVYDLGPVTLGLDGGYMFSHFAFENDKDKAYGKPSAVFGPRRNDILLNAKVGILELVDLNIALNSYANPNTETEGENADKLYDRYTNVAIHVDAIDILPGLTVKGVYAMYSQDSDWLYEVTADYQVIPDTLKVWAGHRNSMFWEDKEAEKENSWDKIGVVGGANKGDKETRYIGDTKPIDKLWKRDNSVNVGVEYKFTYDILSATATAEYDTTNPAKRYDYDDLVTLGLKAEALDFKLNQKLGILIPDDATKAEKRDSKILVLTDNRYDYELDFYTPKYALPVPMMDEIFVMGKVNFDWDKNYVEKDRNQVIAAVEVGAAADVWRLDDLYFGAILAYDLPSEEVIKDAFKYALISKYEAPNGIRFRLEYNSSIDYATTEVAVGDAAADKWIHNKNLNDRYDDIRFYDNSKFHGVRFVMGFPF